RAAALFDGRGLVPGDRYAGGPPVYGFWDGEGKVSRRRRCYRLRYDQRAAGICVFAGFYRFWRVAVRNACRKDLQDHGPGHEERRAGSRAERLGRGAYTGGRGIAGRLCRHFLSQYHGIGRGAANIGHYGALRGRRGVLARYYGFYFNGREYILHVRDRAERGKNGYPRTSDLGRSGRR